jgi:hypothetical protein
VGDLPRRGELFEKSPLPPTPGKRDAMGQDWEPGIPQRFERDVVHCGLDQDDVIRLKCAAPVNEVRYVFLEAVAPPNRAWAEIDEEDSGVAQRDEALRLFLSLAW